MPEFPDIKYVLGWRNIISIDTQQEIIAEVKRISYSVNPKIWIGIKWLATYIAIRPNELRNLKERHININGCFIIPHPKEKSPKIVAMLDEDIELYKSMPKGFPDMYFFRHNEKGRGAVNPGTQFGKDYFYKWWKQACRNLGIEGVDLYGGTRHSTTTALSEFFTVEQLRESGTMHATNKAFERYMQGRKTQTVSVYEKAREIQKAKAKVIKFNKKSRRGRAGR